MFYYVYVLKSHRRRLLYIGYTHNLVGRIKQHNSGQVTATKDYRPWRFVYYEAYRSKQDALKREKRLKQFKNSYKELRKRIQQSITTT